MCHAFAAEGRENIPIHKSVFSKVQCTLVPKENRLIYILHKKTLHSIKNMTIMQTLENVKVVFKSSTLGSSHIRNGKKADIVHAGGRAVYPSSFI